MAKKLTINKTSKKTKNARVAIDVVTAEANERFAAMEKLTKDQIQWIRDRDEFTDKLLKLAKVANDYNR